MNWYMSLTGSRFTQSQNDCMTQLYIMQQVNQITAMVDNGLAAKQMKIVENLYSQYRNKGGVIPNQGQ